MCFNWLGIHSWACFKMDGPDGSPQMDPQMDRACTRAVLSSKFTDAEEKT